MSVDFIDTNVFVYLFDRTDAHKRGRAERLSRQALETGNAAISYQVVQETFNVITGKLKPPASAEDAHRLMNAVLAPLWRVMPSQRLYQSALEIKTRYGFSFYDALIIAHRRRTGSRLHSALQRGPSKWTADRDADHRKPV